MTPDIRRTALACLGAVIVFIALRSLSWSWYSVDLSGIPDEGLVPAGLLPWFLFAYHAGGSVWSDRMRLATWLTACAAYVLPPIVAFVLVRTARARIFAVVTVFALVMWACLSIPAPPPSSEFITYFTAATIRTARGWIIALAAAGVVIGVVASRRDRPRPGES